MAIVAYYFSFSITDKTVVRSLKFEYTMETNKTGTVVFLVPFWISFVYPPLLNIELSTDIWRLMHNSFLSLLRINRIKSLVRALKFKYMTETNKTGTVVFLVCFWPYFLYPPLFYIELSSDWPRSPDRFHFSKFVLQ